MKKRLIILLMLACSLNAEEWVWGRSRIVGTGYRQEEDRGNGKLLSSLYPPALWYEFNYNDSTIAYDLSGNNNTGTVSGATWVADTTGGHYSFDAAGEEIVMANNPAMTSSIPCSITAWVKRDNTTGAHFIFVRGNNGNHTRDIQISFLSGAATLQGIVFDDDPDDKIYIGRKGPCVATNWTHLAMVYTGGVTTASIKLYRNGVQVDNEDISAGSFSARQRGAVVSRIGRLDTGNELSGLIDAFVFHPYALTSNQVLKLYQRGQ